MLNLVTNLSSITMVFGNIYFNMRNLDEIICTLLNIDCTRLCVCIYTYVYIYIYLYNL